jgi:hypothetical protein
VRVRGRRLNEEGRLIWPVTGYDHDGGRCSITGGEVYRGRAIPGLHGRYVYGDFCRGTLWTLDAEEVEPSEDVEDVDVREEAARLPGVSSFGSDRSGELYAVSIEGAILRLVAPDVGA